jgi:hypothetical protein
MTKAHVCAECGRKRIDVQHTDHKWLCDPCFFDALMRYSSAEFDRVVNKIENGGRDNDR